MAEVKLDDITVRYGSKTAIDHFSLHVRDGECLTLLGPSPCGKTTVLRAIAGLAKPDAGEVSIGGTVVASKNRRVFLPPEKRNVGVVFQDYAVWPHMTVEENVSYPLKKRRFPRAEMRNRVDGALEQVRMAQYAKRLPYQLSGGQQQRVALARALVATQDVVLLDEPLCNLDANLREEMRFEIKQLQRDTGITIIYVTHNQDIALVISDRIAVMDRAGAIRQLGEPESLFKNPVDSFVYRFLGVSNFIPVELAEGQMYVRDETETIPFPYPIPANLDTNKFYAACRPMNVALARPSDASIPAPASGEDRGLRGVVKRVIFLGNIYEYR
ncbi:MAG: ABC transporter ATP-binding protein, partial [Firmicutes bacterium]|nr:ABC transporter ATP-binding protein [Bacillota bacterium]